MGEIGEYTKTGRKIQNKSSAVKERGWLRRNGGASPSRRSDTVDPRCRKARPEKVERGLHTQTESEDSLVREGHAPSSDDQHDRCFLQQGRRTTGNAAGWCVSGRSWQTCVDLASKFEKKTKKIRPMHTVDDTRSRPLPKLDHLRWIFRPEPKERKQNKKKHNPNHHSPKKLGEKQLPCTDSTRGNKTSTS